MPDGRPTQAYAGSASVLSAVAVPQCSLLGCRDADGESLPRGHRGGVGPTVGRALFFKRFVLWLCFF
jgi:hypothetical protein